MRDGVLVCVATPMECTLLEATGVRVLVTGVGPVNAAIALTREIARHRPREIVSCGVGGAYPGAGLEVGDVACAATECYGDLGAESPEGFLDLEALGFPVVPGTPPFRGTIPLDLFPAGTRLPFVTCSTCTGTDERALAMEKRTRGAVESMEGAAIAQAARVHGIPVGEVRGISNRVGRRDRAAWRLAEAARAAQEALLRWLA